MSGRPTDFIGHEGLLWGWAETFDRTAAGIEDGWRKALADKGVNTYSLKAASEAFLAADTWRRAAVNLRGPYYSRKESEAYQQLQQTTGAEPVAAATPKGKPQPKDTK